MILHPRVLTGVIARRLRSRPIAVLTGARQSGKTTLARDLLPADAPSGYAYFSLDDPEERLRLAADPVRRLDHEDKIVVLDEVQKQPGLLDAVKLLADRRKGHRFLLLGSAQILLLRHVRETLAGRATLLTLRPLGLAERVEGTAVPETTLDRIWREGEPALEKLASEPPPVETARVWQGRAEEQLLWGGYPALQALTPEERRVWFRDYRSTYLERDLADLGRVADLDQLALAQNLLAARTAGLLSYSEVARELGAAANTVKRYVRFLEISYQLHLLRPFLPTVTASLVKSPKVYWTDPGPARLLSQRFHPDDGALFETYVLDEILRWTSWRENPPEVHFYRTHAGREVDFVLVSPETFLLLEAKAGRRAHAADARPLADLVETLRRPRAAAARKRLGLVVYRGREVQRLAPSVWAVPDWRLFGPADMAAAPA